MEERTVDDTELEPTDSCLSSSVHTAADYCPLLQIVRLRIPVSCGLLHKMVSEMVNAPILYSESLYQHLYFASLNLVSGRGGRSS